MPYFAPASSFTGEEIRVGGVSKGTRPALNVIAGSFASAIGADNSGTNAVDVTISGQAPPTEVEKLKWTANGLTGWSFDLAAAATNLAPTSNVCYGIMLPLFNGQVVTNLHWINTVAGASVTLLKVGIGTLSGTTLTVQKASADLSGTQNVTGRRTGALSSTYTKSADGTVYALILTTYTSTAPQYRGGSGAGVTAGNDGTGSGIPYAVSGAATDLTGTITVGTYASDFWFGWT